MEAKRDRLMFLLLSALRVVVLFLMCLGVWFLFSLDMGAGSAIIGILLALCCMLYSYNIFYSSDISPSLTSSKVVFPKVHLLIYYIIILLIQSYVASFTVIYLMFTGRYKPKVIRIKTRLRKPLAKVILANTISLIPGTLTMWVDGRHLYVHCFDIDSTNSIKAGRDIKDFHEKLLGQIFG